MSWLFHFRNTSDGGKENPWGLLSGSLAEIARHDPRPRVADAAAAALLEIMEVHSSKWDAASWNAVYLRGIAYMLELPDSLSFEISTGALHRNAALFLSVSRCVLIWSPASRIHLDSWAMSRFSRKVPQNPLFKSWHSCVQVHKYRQSRWVGALRACRESSGMAGPTLQH